MAPPGGATRAPRRRSSPRPSIGRSGQPKTLRSGVLLAPRTPSHERRGPAVNNTYGVSHEIAEHQCRFGGHVLVMERQAEILAGWVRALADHQPDTKETE